MAVADLVQEVFESEAVRGPLATRGVLDTAMGAWATGSAAVFLNDSAGTDGGAAGTAVFARGGTRRSPRRSRAPRGRSASTSARGTEVAQIRSKDGRVARRHPRRRHRDRRRDRRVSAADPKATARLCDPVELGPTLVWRTENIRQPGATAKVNLALGGLPAFDGADDPSSG